MANIYIAQNEVELMDDWLQFGQQETMEFHSISNIREYDDNHVEEDYYVSLFLRYDRNYESYERKIYSVLDLLGDIGGLNEALFFIGFCFIGIFQKRMLTSAIMSNVYQNQKLDQPKLKKRQSTKESNRL